MYILRWRRLAETIVIGQVRIQFLQAIAHQLLLLRRQRGELRIVLDLGELVRSGTQFADRRAQSFGGGRQIGVVKEFHMIAQGVRLRVEILYGEGHGQRGHQGDDAGRAADRPQQPATRLTTATPKGGRLFETLTKQLGHAIRFARLGRRTGERRPFDGRRPQVQIDAPKRQRPGFLFAACQEVAKPCIHVALALFDAFHPVGGRVAGLGQQIALGQHQEHRQSAHLGALTAAGLQMTQEAIELDEIRLDLRRRRGGVDHQHERIRLDDFVSQRTFGAVLGKSLPAHQQIVCHPSIAVDDERADMPGTRRPFVRPG